MRQSPDWRSEEDGRQVATCRQLGSTNRLEHAQVRTPVDRGLTHLLISGEVSYTGWTLSFRVCVQAFCSDVCTRWLLNTCRPTANQQRVWGSFFFTKTRYFIKFTVITGRLRMLTHDLFAVVSFLLHCALSLAAQYIVIGPVCGFVCLFVCVCGSVTTITRNCVHRSSPNWVCR